MHPILRSYRCRGPAHGNVPPLIAYLWARGLGRAVKMADCGVDVIGSAPRSDPGTARPSSDATVAALERGTHLEDLSRWTSDPSYGISTCSDDPWNRREWWGVERFARDFAAVGAPASAMSLPPGGAQ